MDLITQLFNQIPEKWRPYVAIVLLLLYVITKVRSEAKTSRMSTPNEKTVLTCMLSNRDAMAPNQLKKQNAFMRTFHKIMDFFC